MPLPLAFATHNASRKSLYSITEDDERSDGSSSTDDVLTLLRHRAANKNKQEHTSLSSKALTPSSSRSSSDTASTRQKPSGGSVADRARITLEDNASRAHVSRESGALELESKSRGDAPSFTSHSASNITNSELHKLTQSVGQIIEALSDMQRVAEERYSDNQDDNLRQAVEKLQTLVVAQESRDEGTSRSLDVLLSSVSEGQEDIAGLYENMSIMAEEFKSSNADHKEAMANLKQSTQLERKAFGEQKAAFEREIDRLYSEKKELEVERQGIAIEKEKLYRDRKTLEQSEALFEQRKLASKEDLENADSMMCCIREAEARINDEMERLVELSEFIKQKDVEAQSKLVQAEQLSKRLELMDFSVKQEIEKSVTQEHELAEKSLHLLRERVALLKDRSKDVREQQTLSRYNGESALANDFSSIQPTIRRALSSIKSDLNRLAE